MLVIYHERYRDVYSSDPAAVAGRIESIYNELHGHFEFVKPEPATEADLELVHSRCHIESVKRDFQRDRDNSGLHERTRPERCLAETLHSEERINNPRFG